MIAEMKWSLRNLPRDSLEEIAFRALLDIRRLRSTEQPNGFFFAVVAGFLVGAAFATSGFLVGAAIR
jgi:hypothetical protein